MGHTGSVIERPSADPARPYLSVVATSRNDDHGGGLLHRMQIFSAGLIAQCKRHGLRAELVLVEWNPPTDRPALIDALHWPDDLGSCDVRVIQVPPDVHYRFRHAGSLPLFQMIAKNVGIRRARGEFVLATNVDILFSDELVQFLAARALDPRHTYRIDRWDVARDVPLEGGIDAQLEYCRTHLLRLHAAEGTYPLYPDGVPMLQGRDVAAPGDGITFGRGFFPSMNGLPPFRDAMARAEVWVQGDPRSAVLALDLDAWDEGRWIDVSKGGRLLASGGARGRQTLGILFPPGSGPGRYVLQTRVSGVSAPPRRCYRLRRARWLDKEDFMRGGYRSGFANSRVLLPGAGAGPTEPDVNAAEPLPSEINDARAEAHTNGCGDFTLLSRDRWFELRGYPEFEMFSFHLDSALCFAAHYGVAPVRVLDQPMRIYHVEHGVGSGWTPEGQQELFERVAEKRIPTLDEEMLMEWAYSMRTLRHPFIFNRSDWGLARESFCEDVLAGTLGRAQRKAASAPPPELM